MWVWLQTHQEVTKFVRRGTRLESGAIEGDSPVLETNQAFPARHPSTAGHVEPCGNSGGPPSKAKYYSTTDSEQVP